MKRLLPLLYGFIPLVLGAGLNFIMMEFDVFPPLRLIGLLFLLLWGFLAYQNSQSRPAVGLMMVFPLIDLLLLFYQEGVLHAYWPNLVGQLSQYFYLHTLSLGYALTFWSSSVFSAYVGAFCLMFCSASIGYLLGRRRNHT